MEAVGIVECFMYSEDDRKLWYIKSYSDVVAHNPYHGKEVKKLECVGHIHTETFRCKIEKIINYK